MKKVLGNNDYQYQTIADKLSLEIVQCGIDAFNFCKTPTGEIDYVNAIKSEESYLKEYEYSCTIASTSRAMNRAFENVMSCKQYIEKKAYYLCWFCGNNPPEEKSKFQEKIYKETNRTYSLNKRSVQYSSLLVSIPRCPTCQKAHRQSSNKLSIPIFVGLGLGLIIGIFVVGFWFAGLLTGLLIGGGFGWIIGVILQSDQNVKNAIKRIKNTSESSIKKYPPLKEKLSEGWSFSRPIA